MYNLGERKMKKSIDAAGMIKVLLIVSLWFCASSLVFADQKNEVFYLEEAMKPLFIAVNDTYCFIGERFSIFQYTVKDFKFIKEFGGKGQGPGQFPVILDMHTTPEYLIVSSLSRVYIYSKDGEYVSETRRRQAHGLPGSIWPVGNSSVRAALKKTISGTIL
jgi:hypothetical protein